MAAIAAGRIGKELSFGFPEVLDAIRLCSENLVAVLGVELFQLTPAGLYQTVRLSGYEHGRNKGPQVFAEWPEYLAISNGLANEFVTNNPARDHQIYVLTTSSWEQFCEIVRLNKR